MKLGRMKIALVTGAAVAALLAFGGVAQAAESEVGSVVSLSYKAKRHVFKGWVDSRGDLLSPDAALCVANRKVELFRARKGKDRSFGWIRSNVDGAFAGRLSNGTPEGKYYVLAHKKTFTDSYGDLVVCRPDRSNEVAVR